MFHYLIITSAILKRKHYLHDYNLRKIVKYFFKSIFKIDK